MRSARFGLLRAEPLYQCNCVSRLGRMTFFSIKALGPQSKWILTNSYLRKRIDGASSLWLNNSLQSVVVRRFKGIKLAPFDASEINVFIGANNSGKSSIAQIIHFGIGLLQAIELAEQWETSRPSASA